ncbi:acetyl xylan esterase [Archangium violaceum]|uniref:SGNH/GDSL hydrolase family protein n=1 Tax=Archangium violaceum TaxID=83451 RepID=UPI00194F06FA|nr:SGNH/GDSL hydrolase family protein [Archangium violaceum]QRN97304.1 acetyl xylan esterase [Archangium violaceum]
MSHSRFAWLLPLVPVLVMAGCEPFEPWFDYAADDPNLQLIGRMDRTTLDGPTYAHPGVTIRFRCNCTGVDVAFADKGTGGEEHTNWVNVIVDGETKAKIKLEQGDARFYKGARDLKPGEHLIEIVKRTESYAGDMQFLGLSLQGIILEPPPQKTKRLEIIGDSISCGYGNEVRIFAPTYTEPNTGYHSKNEDISKAYGSLLGRRFDADVVTTCISGTGVYRNLNGATERDKTFPGLYPRVFPSQEKPLWDTSKFVPDIIIINLGNNDFNVVDENTKLPHPPPEQPFKDAYRDFVVQLREYYPNAKIICSIGPMMNDNYPPGLKQWTNMQKYVGDMVAALDDPNVHYFSYSPVVSDPYGEDWHPTAEVHEQMANEIAPVLQELGF